jgi:hypothetical protein
MGIAGKPAEVSRTLTVVMTDAMCFARRRRRSRQTVRFVVRNAGRMLHEMVIGPRRNSRTPP